LSHPSKCFAKGCDAQKTLDSIRLFKEAGVDGVNIPDGPRRKPECPHRRRVFGRAEIGIEAVRTTAAATATFSE
jgi:hypothetical protein